MSTQLTAQQIAYFEAHADDNLVPNVIIASSISGFLSVVILTLRFVSRWIMLGRLRLDLSDWFLVVAWIFFMMFNIGWTLGTRYGIGRHIIFATDIRMLQIVSWHTLDSSFLANRVFDQGRNTRDSLNMDCLTYYRRPLLAMLDTCSRSPLSNSAF